MISAVHKHSHQFSVLAIGLGLGFVGLVIFNYSKPIQQLIGWCMAIAYFGWGMIHHYLDHNLTKFIVLEYLLVAALAGTLLHSVILAR